MGIGDNFPKGKQVDYVLGRFTPQEFELLPAMMDKAIDMILGFCTLGIAQTMTLFND
jgi:PTH1 family peptidyl-tRNA hydrolase